MKRLMLLAALLITAATFMTGCDGEEKRFRAPGPVQQGYPHHHGHRGY